MMPSSNVVERRDRPPIDIVVPVYNARDDLERCVASLLMHTPEGCRIVLIDDASPDPRIADYFASLETSADPRLHLLKNARNLGFTLTANRGMTLSRADVVLLNSDTIVTAGWIEALTRCAMTDARVGTITPFSNNAEICSFPRFCENNHWELDRDPEATRRALNAAAVPSYPDLPTGVGFCMYVRRALIDAIGIFDPAFGAGYGEENDFCMRAAAAGYRNVLCDDAFVVHLGERSFEGRKASLGERNLVLLHSRQPDYDRQVREFITADPLRALREAAVSRMAIDANPERGVLHVIHDHGGGTESHVRDLISASSDRWRHYLAIAVDDDWQIEEHRRDGSLVIHDFKRGAAETWGDFIGGICASFGVTIVHLHNISHCRDGLLHGIADLEVAFGYTVHDLNFACPTITMRPPGALYCGAVTDPRVCTECLAAQPEFASIDIVQWRERHGAAVRRADFVIAPSQFAAATFARYFSGREIAVIPHGTVQGESRPTRGTRLALLLPDDQVPTVVVLGAIGPDKGARRIERLVELARARDDDVRFVVIGYLDCQHGPWQSDDERLTVHGRYEPQDLPDLLRHYRARLVLYPSEGPETFSYTLSEAGLVGLPALVPPIGALAERVNASGAGFVMSDAEWREEREMLGRILALFADASRDAVAKAVACARSTTVPTPRDMAEATLACYAATLGKRSATRSRKPLSRERLRDALGFHPWHPPIVTSPPAPVVELALSGPVHAAPVVATPPPHRSWRSRLAYAALALRKTMLGRLLHRIVPAPLVNALKAHLD